MAAEVRRIAEREAPWGEWKVVLFNTGPQMGYYLDSSHRLAKEEEVRQALRDHPRTIVVTYFKTMDQVQAVVGSSSVVRERSILPGSRGDPLKTALSQVAFIPRKESEGAVTPRR
jgi:hypothetical protein